MTGQQRLPLPQLRQRDLMPYVTVGTDVRGSACWLVVDRDVVIECASGNRAVAVMQELMKTKGL
jgi:rhodanese-related sulfurtransferase